MLREEAIKNEVHKCSGRTALLVDGNTRNVEDNTTELQPAQTQESVGARKMCSQEWNQGSRQEKVAIKERGTGSHEP